MATKISKHFDVTVPFSQKVEKYGSIFFRHVGDVTISGVYRHDNGLDVSYEVDSITVRDGSLNAHPITINAANILFVVFGIDIKKFPELHQPLLSGIDALINQESDNRT